MVEDGGMVEKVGMVEDGDMEYLIRIIPTTIKRQSLSSNRRKKYMYSRLHNNKQRNLITGITAKTPRVTIPT